VKSRLVVLPAALLLLAAPASASAATFGVSPSKACYRDQESLAISGSGYTPGGVVNLTSNGSLIPSNPPIRAGSTGAFGATLTVGLSSGEKVKTYAATDQSNPELTAAQALRVTAVAVRVSPKNGRPGRWLHIRARGFTTGKRLYAHIRRGKHYRRNVRIGRLKGACHRLNVRKRLFSSHTPEGTYKVQFDGRRHYSRKAKVKISFTVFVHRTFHPASVASELAVGEVWTRER
jgi:hypothetical protein